jgi:hypothetical protein
MEQQENQQNGDLKEQAPSPQPTAADDNDFALGKACDLSGEGTCEACQ